MTKEIEIKKYSTVIISKDLYDELKIFAYERGYNPNKLGERFIRYGMHHFENIKKAEFKREQDHFERLVLDNLQTILKILSEGGFENGNGNKDS